MERKIGKIILYTLPILMMVGLIQNVQDDYLLTVIYILCTCALLTITKDKRDLVLYGIGFLAMIVSETIFIRTGVEVFVRHSLFGIMPLWLPFLWGYVFVTIKRCIKILGR